jgi:hypothetical protein
MPDLSYIVTAVTGVLLLICGNQNRKQGWRRKRYDFIQALHALATFINSLHLHSNPARIKDDSGTPA